MKVQIAAAMSAALVLGACTTTEKVNVMQPGDRSMTCTQLRAEFARLDEIKRDAQGDQGVNGANVAGFLLFPLAIAGNYLTARDAMQLAEQRRTHLMAFHDEKRCDNPANANVRFSVPRSLLGPIGRGVSN